MQSSTLQDDSSASLEMDKRFYYGADFVLEALAEKPEEFDLIREEIKQHLKRLEDASTPT